MRRCIASNFNAFKVLREDGALMGPWNPWLHEPGIGRAIWDFTMAMTANATLPDNVRQIVILVVGARYDAAYEIYAHIAVAEREGMRPERLAALVADLKPADLTPEENVAFDLAYKLVRGGVLPEPLVQARGKNLRPPRDQRDDLSRRPVRPGVDHPQRFQRAGSGAGIGRPRATAQQHVARRASFRTPYGARLTRPPAASTEARPPPPAASP